MKPQVTLRRLPYPYRAMLAICSDLDETPTRNEYWEIMKFLNREAGLEVGNSIYFDMPKDQFSYWNTDDAGREMIRTLIQSGHIDCLHSYGDLAQTRMDAGRAIEELVRHNCRLKVWVDHGTAPTNFGADIMQGFGDVSGHPAYHADLTSDYGIQYVWRGRVTSLISQDTRPDLCRIFNLNHPFVSARTLAKEAGKRVLARIGNPKYALHRSNRVLQKGFLRDGREVYEFLRTNPHWGGVSSCDTGRGIDKVLTEKALTQITTREGVGVLYTHLGKKSDPSRPIPPSAAECFLRLAKWTNEGKILVATTFRLLDYLATRDQLKFQVEHIQDTVRITLQAETGDFQGITFETDRTEKIEIKLANGRNIPFNIHHQDQRTFIIIPWRQLEVPSL
jgi:hypothetical protein